MALISDRISKIQFLLGNRTDIDDRIVGWAGDAWRELGSTVPFVQLEETFEDQFIVGEEEYPYPEEARAVKSIVIFPTANSAFRPRKKDIRMIESYSTSIPGTPAIWAPYNNSILVRPIPNVALDFRWRCWMNPVLVGPGQATPLLMPDDWLTVFDHLAAMIGNASLGQGEKAHELDVLLHGDPKHPDKPGWIKRKMLREAAENVVSDYATDPMVRPYTGVR